MTDSAKPTVILLFGDDELALEERLTDFIARLAEPANAEINLSRFSAARLDMETFETQLLAAPFLAPRRMVVLDLGTLVSRRLDFPERFFHLLETMPATSVVVALERVDFQALARLCHRGRRPGACGGLALLSLGARPRRPGRRSRAPPSARPGFRALGDRAGATPRRRDGREGGGPSARVHRRGDAACRSGAARVGRL